LKHIVLFNFIYNKKKRKEKKIKWNKLYINQFNHLNKLYINQFNHFTLNIDSIYEYIIKKCL